MYFFWMYPEFLPRRPAGAPPPGRARGRRLRGEAGRVRRMIAENWRDADERLLGRLAPGLLRAAGGTGGRIDLCVQNGVVILNGEVASGDVRAALTARAWAEAGVHDVCDMLTVTDPDAS